MPCANPVTRMDGRRSARKYARRFRFDGVRRHSARLYRNFADYAMIRRVAGLPVTLVGPGPLAAVALQFLRDGLAYPNSPWHGRTDRIDGFFHVAGHLQFHDEAERLAAGLFPVCHLFYIACTFSSCKPR